MLNGVVFLVGGITSAKEALSDMSANNQTYPAEGLKV